MQTETSTKSQGISEKEYCAPTVGLEDKIFTAGITADAAKFEIQTLPRLIFPNEILQIQSFTDFFDASTVKSRSEDR